MTLPPLCVDSSSTSPCPNLEEFVFFSAKSVCDDAQLNSSSIFDTLATMEESQELATSTSTDLILSVNEQSDFMVEKPTYSYATLIGMAILETEEKRARLSTIYSWITNRFPYYRLDSGGWQNSIRHNLTVNKCFVKDPREDDPPGKGSFWKIHPDHLKYFESGVFEKPPNKTDDNSDRPRQRRSSTSGGSSTNPQRPSKRQRKSSRVEKISETTSTTSSSAPTASQELIERDENVDPTAASTDEKVQPDRKSKSKSKTETLPLFFTIFAPTPSAQTNTLERIVKVDGMVEESDDGPADPAQSIPEPFKVSSVHPSPWVAPEYTSSNGEPVLSDKHASMLLHSPLFNTLACPEFTDAIWVYGLEHASSCVSPYMFLERR